MAQASGGTNQDDFNSGMIQATLLCQLQKILDRYPDDNQIIKVCFAHTGTVAVCLVLLCHNPSQFALVFLPVSLNVQVHA